SVLFFTIAFFYFFFTHPPTPNIYTLSLHDALPISPLGHRPGDLARRRFERPDGVVLAVDDLHQDSGAEHVLAGGVELDALPRHEDRKSTRLNSSHLVISYAVFCLKKKKKINKTSTK